MSPQNGPCSSFHSQMLFFLRILISLFFVTFQVSFPVLSNFHSQGLDEVPVRVMDQNKTHLEREQRLYRETQISITSTHKFLFYVMKLNA